MEARNKISNREHSQVIQFLERFQEGYTSRILSFVSTYVDELFTEDSMVIGTGADEWCMGIDEVTKLVHSDWAEWGDLRIEPEKARVIVTCDTAWVAVPGTVSLEQIYPIRVTGSLVLKQGKWKVKQMTFSYPHPRTAVPTSSI